MSACLLQGAHAGLQWQAFGAFIAFKQATGSSTNVVFMLVMLVRYVSHVMEKPAMKHQQLTRDLARFPSLLHPVVYWRRKVSHAWACLHQPKNPSVESLFQDWYGELVPGELVRNRKQTHELAQVWYYVLVSHLLVTDKFVQLLLNGIAEAGTAGLEHKQYVVKGHIACNCFLRSVHIALHQQHDLRVHQLRQHIHGRSLIQRQRLAEFGESLGSSLGFGFSSLGFGFGSSPSPLLHAQTLLRCFCLLHLQ
mmetsp:Transcript_74808/g.178581  ORF Transcript_74808/g.178581 Transcript_74808/m.178581 type:complete len:251 (-) Transcript_74808:1739-2491(-)